MNEKLYKIKPLKFTEWKSGGRSAFIAESYTIDCNSKNYEAIFNEGVYHSETLGFFETLDQAEIICNEHFEERMKENLIEII